MLVCRTRFRIPISIRIYPNRYVYIPIPSTLQLTFPRTLEPLISRSWFFTAASNPRYGGPSPISKVPAGPSTGSKQISELPDSGMAKRHSRHPAIQPVRRSRQPEHDRAILPPAPRDALSPCQSASHPVTPARALVSRHDARAQRLHSNAGPHLPGQHSTAAPGLPIAGDLPVVADLPQPCSRFGAGGFSDYDFACAERLWAAGARGFFDGAGDGDAVEYAGVCFDAFVEDGARVAGDCAAVGGFVAAGFGRGWGRDRWVGVETAGSGAGA